MFDSGQTVKFGQRPENGRLGVLGLITLYCYANSTQEMRYNLSRTIHNLVKDDDSVWYLQMQWLWFTYDLGLYGN